MVIHNEAFRASLEQAAEYLAWAAPSGSRALTRFRSHDDALLTTMEVRASATQATMQLRDPCLVSKKAYEAIPAPPIGNWPVRFGKLDTDMIPRDGLVSVDPLAVAVDI